MASLRTLVVNIILKNRPENMAAQIDQFADNFDELIKKLKIL